MNAEFARIAAMSAAQDIAGPRRLFLPRANEPPPTKAAAAAAAAAATRLPTLTDTLICK